MLSLLCCSCPQYVFVSSPTGAPTVSSFTHTGLDVAGNCSVSQDPGGISHEVAKLGYKLQSLPTETLLPGQLPETPKDPLVGPTGNVVWEAGPQLLEDTLAKDGRTGATSGGSPQQPVAEHQQSAEPRAIPATAVATIPALAVPNHLRGGSATLDADFRCGELNVSLVGPGAQLSPRSLSPSRCSPSGVGPLADGGSAVAASPLPSNSMWHAVSRSSGRKVLYRCCRPPPPDPAAALPGNATPAPSAASAASTVQDVASDTDALQRQRVVLAWQQLQRELDLAAQLPRCPALLLPSRVYVQPQSVHVVYDGYGVELLSYMLERQCLPEALCRSIMRQVLQALAALHEEGWIHRNVSSETIWVEEQQPERGRPPRASSEAQPPALALDGAEPSAACAPATVLSTQDTSGPHEAPRETHLEPVESDNTQRQQDQPLPRLRVWLGGLALAVRPGPKPDDSTSGGDTGGMSSSGQEVLLRDLVGCAYHLAPEAISGAGYSRPADVWAAGVLLVMMLTGRPPFPGQNELEVMTRVLLAASEREADGGIGGGRDKLSPQQPREQERTADGDALASWDAAAAAHHRHADSSTGAAAASNHTDPGGSANKPRRPPHAALDGTGNSGRQHPPAGDSEGEEPSANPGSRPDPSLLGLPGQQQPDALQKVVVKAVLESGASEGCREALAGMLVADPARRLSAAELLRLPWFAVGD